MRLRHADGQVIHVAYCTNVHPAEDLDGVLAQLDRFAVPVREALDSDVLGLGLWLAAPLAARLARDASKVAQLRSALTSRGLEVVTLNGFPFSGFQQPVVKHAVYQPDWTSPARLDYTVDLATVLAELLPDDAQRGSISTLPLAWRTPWYSDRQQCAEEQLQRLGYALDSIESLAGRSIRVGLEPEPGCVIETTDQAVKRLAAVGHPGIGVCLDACHLAVQFEEPAVAVATLRGAGLPIVKMQASAALQVAAPATDQARAALAAFDEPRFLHQVREWTSAGPRQRDDLGDALRGKRALTGRDSCGSDLPWRIHYHVPLAGEIEAPMTTTADHLNATLGELFGGDVALTDHIEAETYTWGVLPERERPTDDRGLAAGIAAELNWLRDTLVSNGLKEENA